MRIAIFIALLSACSVVPTLAAASPALFDPCTTLADCDPCNVACQDDPDDCEPSGNAGCVTLLGCFDGVCLGTDGALCTGYAAGDFATADAPCAVDYVCQVSTPGHDNAGAEICGALVDACGEGLYGLVCGVDVCAEQC